MERLTHAVAAARGPLVIIFGDYMAARGPLVIIFGDYMAARGVLVIIFHDYMAAPTQPPLRGQSIIIAFRRRASEARP